MHYKYSYGEKLFSSFPNIDCPVVGYSLGIRVFVVVGPMTF